MNPLETLDPSELQTLSSLLDHEGFDSLLKLLNSEMNGYTFQLMNLMPSENDTASLNRCRGMAFMIMILNQLKPLLEHELGKRAGGLANAFKLTDTSAFFPHPNEIHAKMQNPGLQPR